MNDKQLKEATAWADAAWQQIEIQTAQGMKQLMDCENSAKYAEDMKNLALDNQQFRLELGAKSDI